MRADRHPPSFRHFRFLVAGYAVSAFGSHLNLVALNLFAYVLTGSALRTGLFMALRLAAGFVVGLVAGTVVSRYPRKRVMIGADLAQAAALLALAVGPVAHDPGWLYGVAVVTGACSTLSSVSLRSGVPDMVGQDERTRANALLVTSRSLAMVGGLASAGIIVAWAGFTAAFVIDAVTFVVSAANLARLPLLRTVPGIPAVPASGRNASDDEADPDTGTARDRRASFTVASVSLRATPVLFVMILVRAADGFGSASHIVGLPIYATEMNPAEPVVFVSHFWSAWAIGNLLTQQLMTRLVQRYGGAPGERSFAAGTAVMSALFIVAFTGLSSWPLLAVAFLAGLADGFTETAYLSRLQQVDDHRRGAVFGVVSVAETTGLGLGMVTGAALLDRLEVPGVVTLTHGAVIVFALSLLGFLTVAGVRRRTTETARETP